MILKVQRALTDPPSILVYDKPSGGVNWATHTIFTQIPMSLGQIQAILGDDLKGYFEAGMKDGQIVIGDRVPDEKW